MNNRPTFRIAHSEDLESLFVYADNILKADISDDMERMISIWDSRFRKEALEHYLKLGWSFIATIDGNICGFFLGQPLLFFQGQTQALWVEYIIADNPKIKSELVDIAYKLSRDKHFQQVLFPENVQHLEFENKIQFQSLKEPIIWAKTTK